MPRGAEWNLSLKAAKWCVDFSEDGVPCFEGRTEDLQMKWRPCRQAQGPSRTQWKTTSHCVCEAQERSEEPGEVRLGNEAGARARMEP